MNYTVVKQFYNGFVDSIYNLIFKIVDFGKILWETFMAFLEIWEIFFSIFFNLFMYVYYLILFTIDKTLDTNPLPKRSGVKGRYVPQRVYKSSSSGRKSFSASMGSSAGRSSYSGASSRVSRPPAGAKTSFITDAIKRIADFFREVFSGIKGSIRRLAGGIPEIKGPGKKEHDIQQKTGLIDEYLKEYEQSRRR